MAEAGLRLVLRDVLGVRVGYRYLEACPSSVQPSVNRRTPRVSLKIDRVGRIDGNDGPDGAWGLISYIWPSACNIGRLKRCDIVTVTVTSTVAVTVAVWKISTFVGIFAS